MEKYTKICYTVRELSEKTGTPLTTIKSRLARFRIYPDFETGFYDRADLELLQQCQNFVSKPGNSIQQFEKLMKLQGKL